jgi:hypothetical protein
MDAIILRILGETRASVVPYRTWCCVEPLTTAGLAVAVTSALAPILAKTRDALIASLAASGSDLGTSLGKLAGAKVGGMVKLLQSKLSRTPSSRAALDEFVDRPDRPSSQGNFRRALEDALDTDRDFRSKLEASFISLRNTSVQNVATTGDNSTVGFGSGVTIGGNARVRDIRITRDSSDDLS